MVPALATECPVMLRSARQCRATPRSGGSAQVLCRRVRNRRTTRATSNAITVWTVLAQGRERQAEGECAALGGVAGHPMGFLNRHGLPCAHECPCPSLDWSGPGRS